MQVAGIRRVGVRVEMIEASEPRPPAGDEVLLEVRAAARRLVQNGPRRPKRIKALHWQTPAAAALTRQRRKRRRSPSDAGNPGSCAIFLLLVG